MKVKLTIEIDANIPGEFQDDNLATSLLVDEINELLSVGVQFDKHDDDCPSVTFDSINVINYKPGAGKL